MSRIGKKPIEIPKGVDVKVDGQTVTVKGPKGELTQSFDKDLRIELNDGVLTVERPNDIKRIKALHGLTRTLIENMIIGVTEGYSKSLEIIGTNSPEYLSLSESSCCSHSLIFIISKSVSSTPKRTLHLTSSHFSVNETLPVEDIECSISQLTIAEKLIAPSSTCSIWTTFWISISDSIAFFSFTSADI